MDSQEFLQVFTGTAGVVILIIVLLWLVLSFFLPFMVYSIMQSNKELMYLNRKILAELQGKGTTRASERVEPEI